MRQSAAVFPAAIIAVSLAGWGVYYCRVSSTTHTRSRAWNELLSFESKPLYLLDEAQKSNLRRLISEVGTRTEAPEAERLWRGTPFYIWKIQENTTKERVVLLEFAHSRSEQESHEARVHVFAADGGLMYWSRFPSGWDSVIKDVAIVFQPELNCFAIRVTTEANSNGTHNGARQYYGILDNSVSLVRIEDLQGNQISKNMLNANKPVGPPLHVQTHKDLESILMSNDPAIILSALLWLETTYDGKTIHFAKASDQGSRELTRIETALVRRITDLRNSLNPWIRDAARHLNSSQ